MAKQAQLVWVIYRCWFNIEVLEIDSNLVHVASSQQLAVGWIKADYGGRHHIDDADGYFTVYPMVLDRTTTFYSTEPTYYRSNGRKLRKAPKAPWGESEADWK